MLQNTKAGLIAALLLGATSIASAQTTEKKDLAWTFNKGDKSTYTLHWGLDLGQSLRGPQPMDLVTFKVKVSYVLDQEVTAVDMNGATIKATIKSVKASTVTQAMGMPGPEEAYDSSKEGGSKVLAALKEAIGMALTFKMKKTGEVTEVKGGEEITAKLTVGLREAAQKAMAGGGGGGGMMGGMGAQTAAMALIAFENDSIKSALNMLNHVLPSTPGDTWSIEHEQKTKVGNMKFKGKYRFGDSSGGKTRISFKNDGEVSMTKAEGGGAPGLSSMVKDLKVVASKVKGLATFGPGHILNSEVTFVADAEGEATGMIKQRLQMMGGGAGGDMKLGMKYALTLRYERASAKKSEF
ncbi:MAG: hypothetical protein JKY65_31620 [Planctomycetes bacterium]|nr:hypothetical protein [Planctomycetota bacterium]